MVEKWMIVAALVALLLVLVGGAVGYEAAKHPKSSTPQSQGDAATRAGPTRLQTAMALGDPALVASTQLEPSTPPVTSPLPEAMLQLMTLREGEKATLQAAGAKGVITKGCYDKWFLSINGAAPQAYETWGDLTVPLYQLALNAPHFLLTVHGQPYQVTNTGPRLVMQSAQGDSFDRSAINHPPIYTAPALGTTA